jgi:transcriptional regulator with XRE-family HTH domain
MSARFGSLVFHSRVRKCLSQKTIAYKAGIDPSYLASVERGRRPPPRRQVVEKILAALGMSSAEHALAIEAAAIDRLEPAIRDSEQDIPGAAVLVRLCNALPYLSNAKLGVLSDVIGVLAEQPPLENTMR